MGAILEGIKLDAKMYGSFEGFPAWSLGLVSYNDTWAGVPRAPWLFAVYIGDEILARYMGIIISQYKDPY